MTTNIFTSTNYVYVLFPASYSQWISRAQSVTTTYPGAASTSMWCAVNVTGSSTNLATACTFISQRILQITLSVNTNRLYTITLMNILTPAAVPNGKFNQYRFSVFVTTTGSQTAITYYAYTDYSQYLTLTTNPLLISLSWNYYSLSVTNSFFTLTPLTNQVITVQIGYYSNVVELRQSIYPSNFLTTL
jgi:hypothetical protein